ncbi:hypothetical protein EVJ27_11705 [Exiguobacterium sp. SH3S2]|uniref:hypothetical protein n=1 Tax=unclassified Exiguobacterium TaxID=2644629 RepID=UPI00103CF857|nr:MULTISPECIES: hypothetical protein [unclassified Exiguobacterium]TCI42903.1 hypothetical protein EVJ28_11725 [Exiguobacterium sp. SH3S3]TCI58656.1 hypothetical protein EVJ27_11705 [Exiguobacterium sp. SH3S2]
MKIQSIHLTFENLEGASFPMDVIESFRISDLKDGMTYSETTGYESIKMVNDVSLVLRAEANQENHGNGYEPWLPFERIGRHRDITHITVETEDGERILYRVQWIGEAFNNSAQQLNRLADERIEIHIHA